MHIQEILKDLCLAYGPSGREDQVAGVIAGMLEGHVDSLSRDAMGNLVAIKKGREPGRVMVAAHMDEIGLMVTHIEDSGLVRVDAVGGVHAGRSIYRQVKFENGVRGVTGCDADALAKPQDITMAHLYIDLGVASAEEAAALVQVGDVAVFTVDFLEMGDRASCAAMDNRVACAVLVDTLLTLDTPQMDVYGVFTTQEELGLRGAQTAAFAIQPDWGVAVDLTLAADVPGSKRSNLKLGGGACIKIKDASVVCSPRVVAHLTEAAQQAGLPYQREVLVAGGTDTKSIQLSRAGVPAGAISVAARYVHAPVEMVDIRDVAGASALLTQALKGGWKVQ